MRTLATTLCITITALTLTATAGAHRGAPSSVRIPVCQVFGRYCDQALSVVRCETGGTYSVWAGYGKHQYLGLFQMGSRERSIYGHGTTPYAQARAAYRYFVASGRDWSPWQCRPGGWLAW